MFQVQFAVGCQERVNSEREKKDSGILRWTQIIFSAAHDKPFSDIRTCCLPKRHTLETIGEHVSILFAAVANALNYTLLQKFAVNSRVSFLSLSHLKRYPHEILIREIIYCCDLNFIMFHNHN